MKARYIQRYDNEGFSVRSGQLTRLRCCDCGLVHDIVFKAGKGWIGIAAKRNGRATANSRRYR